MVSQRGRSYPCQTTLVEFRLRPLPGPHPRPGARPAAWPGRTRTPPPQPCPPPLLLLLLLMLLFLMLTRVMMMTMVTTPQQRRHWQQQCAPSPGPQSLSLETFHQPPWPAKAPVQAETSLSCGPHRAPCPTPWTRVHWRAGGPFLALRSPLMRRARGRRILGRAW